MLMNAWKQAENIGSLTTESRGKQQVPWLGHLQVSGHLDIKVNDVTVF